MKKAYTKPVVYFENFELDAAITLSCTKVDQNDMIDAYLGTFVDISGMTDAEKEAVFNEYALGSIVTDDANSKECYFTHSNPTFQS